MHAMRVVAALIAGILLSSGALAQAASSDMERRLELAMEILQVTEADALARKGMDTQAPMLRDSIRLNFPDASDAQIDRAGTFVMDQMYGVIPDIIERTSVSYAEHFTVDELEELLAFYQTELGQKLVLTQPIIMTELVSFSEELGFEAVMDVQDELTAILTDTDTDK